MAQNLIKIIITGVQVVARAFTKAVQKEYAASQQAAKRAGGGQKGTEQAAQTGLFGMSLDEAKQILNVNDINDVKKVQETFEHLMQVNGKDKGGSFYLQSKVYRAKERIDMETKSEEGGGEEKLHQRYQTADESQQGQQQRRST